MTLKGELRNDGPKLPAKIERHEQRTGSKDNVAGHPEPLPHDHVFVEGWASCVGITVLKDRGQLLPADRVKVQDHP